MPELRAWANKEGVKVFENVLANPSYYSVATAPWRSTNGKAHADFVKYTRVLDVKRGCSIVDYLPEVAEAYGIN
jgi:hypothetical protein